MIVLKWIAALAASVYLGGLALLYFKQRDLLFPIPAVGRTAPAEAGFSEAEEQVLTTSDGEKIIAWYVPAKQGHPVVLFFHGNGDFLAGRVSRFKGVTSDGPDSSRFPFAVMPAQAVGRTKTACCRTPKRPMHLQLHDMTRTGLSPGASRSAPALRLRSRQSTG